MAIKHTLVNRNVRAPGMTVAQFKEWLKRFDADGDGRISREELRTAIRVLGGRFSHLKSRQAIKAADADGNGYVDFDEIENLVAFARKSLGMTINA